MKKIFIISAAFILLYSSPTFCLNLKAPLIDVIFQEDWEKIITSLEKADTDDDPAARLLIGHACLATNRNNAAMLLFLSVQGKSDLSLWTRWTTSFFERHPKSTVAQYLAADALTRTGSFQKSIEGFTRVINSKNSSDLTRALSLNARGVAYVLTNDLEAAQVDFYLATKQFPNFADGYANLGTLNVFQEVSIRQGKGAIEAFDRALTMNPDFALAYNGRGCLYFGNGDFEQATKDFEKAATLIPNSGFIETNLDLAGAYGKQLPLLVKLTSQPGMSLAVKVEQQQSTLQAKQQEMRNVPDEKTILALPHMSPKDQQAVVNKYGWTNVEKAARVTMQRGETKMIANNHEVEKLLGQRKIINKLETALDAIKIIKFARSLTKNIAKIPTDGGKALYSSTEKSVFSASTDSHALKVIIDAIDPNPMVSTLNSVQNIGESVLKDQSGAVSSTQKRVFKETMFLGLQTRNLNHFLNSYPSSARNMGNKMNRPKPFKHQDVDVVRNSTTHQMPIQLPQKVTDIHPKSTVNSPIAARPIKPMTPSLPKINPPPPIKFRMPQISRFSQPPGGVDTEITAFIDKGNWPVLTVFGLIYPIRSAEKP